VCRLREGSERADESFGEEGSHDRRQPEDDESCGQGPAAVFDLGGRLQLPLAPKRATGHRHPDDQEQRGNRKRELGERATVRIAVEAGHRGDEHEHGREADETEGDVRGLPIDRALPAEEQREAEDEQQGLPATEPTSDALTISVRPSAMATIAMISSGALPNVAFRKPPMPGPVWSARLSVASPINQESGISARPARTNSVSSPATSSRSRAITRGPRSSSGASNAPRAVFPPDLSTKGSMAMSGASLIAS
jgi:hypothetical protein